MNFTKDKAQRLIDMITELKVNIRNAKTEQSVIDLFDIVFNRFYESVQGKPNLIKWDVESKDFLSELKEFIHDVRTLGEVFAKLNLTLFDVRLLEEQDFIRIKSILSDLNYLNSNTEVV